MPPQPCRRSSRTTRASRLRARGHSRSCAPNSTSRTDPASATGWTSSPPSGPGAPLFFFIHGGYWRRLDKSFFSFLAEPVVRAGGAAAIVNYPLAPGASIDEIVAAVAARSNGSRQRGARERRSAPDRRRRPLGRRTSWRDARRLFVAAGRRVRAERPLRSRTRTALARERVGAPRCGGGGTQQPGTPLPEAPIRLVAAVGERETDEFKRQTQHYVATWRARRYPAEELIAAGHNHFTIVLELGRRRPPNSRARWPNYFSTNAFARPRPLVRARRRRARRDRHSASRRRAA